VEPPEEPENELGLNTSIRTALADSSPDGLSTALALAERLPPPETCRYPSVCAFALYDATLRLEAERKEWNRCLRDYSRVLDYEFPEDSLRATSWYRIGVCSEELGDFGRALLAYRRALPFGHAWPAVLALTRFRLAGLLVAAEEYEEAAACLQELNRQLPVAELPEAKVRLLWARCLLRVGRPAEAESALKEIRDVAPSSPEAWAAESLLADLYERSGRPRYAVETYRRILKSASASPLLRSAALHRLEILEGR